MAKNVIKISGLKELDAALGELPKATAKAVLRRVLVNAGEPIAQAMRAGAPRDKQYLAESIGVSTVLNPSQKAQQKKDSSPAFQEMYVGTNNPAGMQQEFGNVAQGPQPFARPAWDGKKRETLDFIANSLWHEIQKSAKRLARKAAKG